MKLKLTRDELQAICWLTNPIALETSIVASINTQDWNYLNDYFSLMEVGEKAAKKFLFDHKKKYSLNISYAQASAFWNYADWDLPLVDEHRAFVINKIKGVIHQELTNYQRRYFKPNTHG